MQRWCIVLGVATIIAWEGPAPLSAPQAAPDQPPSVLRLRLDNQAISPITARLIERAIRQAERDGADCLLITLDTPGGLVDSTRTIVKSILASPVPVVVYVAPSGARAASAGVFITLSAHVAAMAPGTNIGAAHPVQVGGLPGAPAESKDEPERTDPRIDKIVNDTVAWARSLAALRDRDADWAARTVSESLSASAEEALAAGAVDLVAVSESDLLERIDGREVTLPVGPTRLRTAGATVQTIEMWWGEQLLGALANPTLAFLLLMIGFYGILFELYTPGWGVGGTLGAVCLLLGFLALAVLPINYVGLALLGVALALFVAEAFVTSYGALTAVGVLCLILGGTMLVESPVGFQRVSWVVLVPVALATALITVLLVGSVVRAHRRRVQTGSAALTSATAVAIQEFTPVGDQFAGRVRVQGELWQAVSPKPIHTGEAVRIEDRQGLVLRVS